MFTNQVFRFSVLGVFVILQPTIVICMYEYVSDRVCVCFVGKDESFTS